MVAAATNKLTPNFGLITPSLYSGTTGIALFNVALAKTVEENGEKTFALVLRNDANAAFSPLVKIASASNPHWIRCFWRDQPLGLGGSGGILLGLELMNDLGQKPQLSSGVSSYIEVAQTIIGGLKERILKSDHGLDIMSGVAGLIGPLLALKDDEAFKLACICGERLIDTQLSSGGWLTGDNKAPLTGFSHGAGGIAAALAHLFQVSGELRFMEASLSALAYERSVFVPEKSNWPDFRFTSKPQRFKNSLCHGASSVGFSRLCLVQTKLWDNKAKEEVKTACTVATDSSDNQLEHLCCGLLGVSAFLSNASRYLDEPMWKFEAERLETIAFEQAKSRNGNYGVFGGTQLPLLGLFTGYSGIGLAMLGTEVAQNILTVTLSAGLLKS